MFFALHDDIVSYDLKAVENAICCDLQHANLTYWWKVKTKILSSDDTAENMKLRNALACPLSTEILMIHLNGSWIPDSPIPFSEAVTAILNANVAGVDVVLDFMHRMQGYFKW